MAANDSQPSPNQAGRAPLERFPFRLTKKSHEPSAESALDSILVAFPIGKPVSTFPGNALAERSERRSALGAEELRLFPRREVTALVDLVEVDQVAIGAPRPCLRGSIDVLGNTLMATGSEISAVLCAAATMTLPPAPFSQYSRADEAAVFVSQYSVMLSSTSSFVGDFPGSAPYVHCAKPGCTRIHAASPAGESAAP
jgi:hypothetical protein